MPVLVCKVGNKPGFKYGASGKCYTYEAGSTSGRSTAKRKAVLQGAAIAQSTGEKLIVKALPETIVEYEEPKKWTKQEALDWLTKYGFVGHDYIFSGYSHTFKQGITELYDYRDTDESRRYYSHGDGISMTLIGDFEEPVILEIRFEAEEKDTLTFELKKEKSLYKDENNLVFGWGYEAIKKSGQQVVDHSKQFVDEGDALKELELATYAFNIGSGRIGFGHVGKSKGYVAECMFFTKEKNVVLGLSEDALPQGAWLGVYFPEDEDYKRVKKMKAPMFSLEGYGFLEEVKE